MYSGHDVVSVSRHLPVLCRGCFSSTVGGSITLLYGNTPLLLNASEVAFHYPEVVSGEINDNGEQAILFPICLDISVLNKKALESGLKHEYIKCTF